MNVEFAKAALDELLDGVKYYNGKRPGLGLEFSREVRSTVKRVADHPEACAILTRRGPTRRCLVRRFPYGLIYVLKSPSVIMIIAVAHLRRRPDYWSDRLG